MSFFGGLSCCSVSFCKEVHSGEDTNGSPVNAPKASDKQNSSKVQSKSNKNVIGPKDNASPQSAGGEAGNLPQVPPVVGSGTLGRKGTRDLDTASAASSGKNSTRSARSASSSIGTDFINDQLPQHQREVARIQSQMKTFVKGMVKGREMSVLSVDGQLRSCTCSFDRKLRKFDILVSKETRSIPLSKIREVFQGQEPEDIPTPLDELCATFVLDKGECLSFRFKDVAERENFAMCLQIIVDGHQDGRAP